MPSIYANTNDGYVGKSNSNWATTRDATSGTFANSTLTAYAFGARSDVVAGRGGGSTYTVVRSFMFFDTSGISSDVQSATLKIYGISNGTGDIIIVKATSDIATIGTADFNAITGWSTGSADGSGAGDNESNVTKYSAEIATWSTSGYNDITLTSTALTDMRDDNYLYICFMNYDYDLKDIAPTGTNRNGLYFANYTGTSRDPYIDYTLAPTVSDNSVFFGTNF